MDGQRWVPRLKAGDPEAYEVLYHTWFPEAYRTAYLVTHDQQLAEDAVQEAFCHVLRSIGTLRDHGRLGSWLHVLVSRAAIDILRRTGSRHAIPVEDIDQAMEAGTSSEPSPAGPPTPEEAALANLMAEEVLRALESLPAVFRQVAVLFYYRQLSVAEIAEALSCAEGTVKSRLARARAHLAKALRREVRETS